jgi:hypothetical protein
MGNQSQIWLTAIQTQKNIAVSIEMRLHSNGPGMIGKDRENFGRAVIQLAADQSSGANFEKSREPKSSPSTSPSSNVPSSRLFN